MTKETDPRKTHELDVDRMIDEGMAGGATYSATGQVQIEQARNLPKEHQPLPFLPEEENDEKK